MSYARSQVPADGSQTEFSVPFPLPPKEGQDGVVVYLHDPDEEPATPAVEGTDYTWASEGLITFTTAPTAGLMVSIIRETDIAVLDKSPQAGGTIKSAELAQNDKQLLFAAQEAQDEIDAAKSYLMAEDARSLRAPRGETMGELPNSATRGSKFMQWEASGTAVLMLSASAFVMAIAEPLEAYLGGLAKGDPGGNVMAIGAFEAAPLLTIAVGTDAVRTSSYHILFPGIGQAHYAYDATVDAAYVAANPRSSFLSANGRGFKIAETLPTVAQFGAASGLTPAENSAAIQAALDLMAAAGGGMATVPGGPALPISTFNVPDHVDLWAEGDLKASDGDRDYVFVGQNSKFSGTGKLDLSGLAAFTSSAVVIPSTVVSWLDSGSEVDIDIIGIDPGPLGAPTGKAVEFRIAALGGHRASFCRIAGNHQYFHTGLACDIPAPPASTVNFASSNRVEAVYFDVVDAVRGTTLSTSSGLGQWVFDYTIQARTTKNTLRRALAWDGSIGRGVINGWDMAGWLADGIAIECSERSERNELIVGGCSDEQVINRHLLGRPNNIVTFGMATGQTQNHSTAPFTLPLPVVSGRQDDHLAYAATRIGWTVTVTDGAGTPVATSSGAVANVFDPKNHSSFARYAAYTGTLVWTIDMGASVTRPHCLGIAFFQGNHPDTLKMETSADALSWVQLYNKSAPGSVGVVEQWRNGTATFPARYVRFTMTTATARDLILYSIWGMFAGGGGNAFAERYRPNIEDQLLVNGTKVLVARRTGWTADTGLAKRTSNATYTAGAALTFTDPPTAAQMTALANRIAAIEAALQNTSQTVKALKDDGMAHGFIGA